MARELVLSANSRAFWGKAQPGPASQLVVPLGLLASRTGPVEQSSTAADFSEYADTRALGTRLGHQPLDVSAPNVRRDIESHDTRIRHLRLFEVKGRQVSAGDFTILFDNKLLVYRI